MSEHDIKTQYPAIAWPLTLLFNLLAFIWWLEVGLRIPFLAAIRFEFAVALLAGIFALLRYFALPARTKLNGDVARPIALYVLVLFVSLPLAVDFNIAWSNYVDHVIKYAVLGVLISQYVVSPSTLGFYLFSTFLAFLKIGQESFLGKLNGSQVWESQGVMRLNGPQGSMFGHPNSLSGKTISMLAFVWYLFPVIKNKWLRLLMLVQLVFAVNIIIFTASRTGYLTCIAMLLTIFAVTKQKRGRLIAIFAAIVILAGTLVPQQYLDRFDSAFTGKEKEGHSADTRMGLFQDSLRVFAEHPLGVGLGCFPIVQAAAGRDVQETHNLYTQILAETGIQGFVFFAVLLNAILRKIRRTGGEFERLVTWLQSAAKTAASESPIAKELHINQFLLATSNGLLVFLIVRLCLGVFGHDLLEIYWWVAAGLAMALANLLPIAQRRAVELGMSTQLATAPGRRAPARSARHG